MPQCGTVKYMYSLLFLLSSVIGAIVIAITVIYTTLSAPVAGGVKLCPGNNCVVSRLCE